MPKTRLPSHAKIKLKELARLGNPTDIEETLRKQALDLGVAANSQGAKTLARYANRWIVRYWTWYNLDRAAPSAQSEALLVEGLIARIDVSIAKRGLSPLTDCALLLAIKPLRRRLAELNTTPQRRGRRRNGANKNLTPELVMHCEMQNPKATRKQIQYFVESLFDIGNIPVKPIYSLPASRVRLPR